MKQRESKI